MESTSEGRAVVNEALIINAAVLTVVLESDLGRRRKITWLRLARPFVTAIIIVPFFIKGVALNWAGLTLEVAGIAVGALLGWATTTQMHVYKNPETGRPATRAGAGYALIWIAVSVARVLFSYGSDHWFKDSLGSWLFDNHISSDALTDALIFMALAMVLTRVAAIGMRARRLSRTHRTLETMSITSSNAPTQGRSGLRFDDERSTSIKPAIAFAQAVGQRRATRHARRTQRRQR